MQKNKTWIEISKRNLLHNLSEFRKIAKKSTSIACVVKANAYGHGLEEVVSVLNEKTDWFAVDSIEEALEVRKLSSKSILVMGFVPLAKLGEAIENNISLTVYSRKILSKIISLKSKKAGKIHLKVETGLNRQGLDEKKVLELTRYVLNNKKYLSLEGLSMHFANIEDTLDSAYAMNQLDVFESIAGKVKKMKVNPILHSAASAAIMLFPKTHFGLVRAGISLYGQWPSKETKLALKLMNKKIMLKPVMSWKSVVAQVKTIETGESVGYGRTWYAPRKSKIAIVPIGYSNGYDRKLSNTGRVLIKGQYAPVVGRVAMNMTTVDVTEIKNVKMGDEVTLIGKSGKNEVTIDELAEKLGTINYEIVSRIDSNLPRIII